MTIYAANIDDLVPTPKKKGGGRKKKVEVETPPPPPPAPEPPKVKEKKPRTEAQIAATKRATEARRAKKMELEKVKAEIKQNEEELGKLEDLKKKKRKTPVQEKTPSLSSTEIVEEEMNKIEEPPQKKKRVRKPKLAAPPPEEPPEYLKKYIEGMLKAQNAVSEVKKPAKQIKTEASEQSKTTWADDVKRDSVKSEVDNHMNRMYSMMFSR